MTVNAKIKERIQKLQAGELVTLFEIDTTIYGGGSYYFTPNIKDNTAPVVFNNITYNPIPAQLSGYTLKSDGSLERPSLAVANTDRAFNAILAQYNNLNGCKVIIRTTFRRYLDDGSDPDINAQVEPQVFRIHQKTS